MCMQKVHQTPFRIDADGHLVLVEDRILWLSDAEIAEREPPRPYSHPIVTYTYDRGSVKREQ